MLILRNGLKNFLLSLPVKVNKAALGAVRIPLLSVLAWMFFSTPVLASSYPSFAEFGTEVSHYFGIYTQTYTLYGSYDYTYSAFNFSFSGTETSGTGSLHGSQVIASSSDNFVLRIPIYRTFQPSSEVDTSNFPYVRIKLEMHPNITVISNAEEPSLQARVIGYHYDSFTGNDTISGDCVPTDIWGVENRIILSVPASSEVSVFADVLFSFSSFVIDDPYLSYFKSLTYTINVNSQLSGWLVPYSYLDPADYAVVNRLSSLLTEQSATYAAVNQVGGIISSNHNDLLDALRLRFTHLEQQNLSNSNNIISEIKDFSIQSNQNFNYIHNDILHESALTRSTITSETTRLINALLNPSDYPPDGDAGASGFETASNQLDDEQSKITDWGFSSANSYDVASALNFTTFGSGIIAVNFMLTAILNGMGGLVQPLVVSLALIFVALLVGVMRFRS